MNAQDFLIELTLKNERQWWEQAAVDAAIAGHARHIRARDGKALYLSRFWLTPPHISDDNDLESGNSLLLHYFHQGDDDDALHDHPWDFDTTILSGGYTEQLPPPPDPAYGNPFKVITGPPLLSEYSHKRRVGDRIFKKSTDMHMAMNPLPGTWTLVRTAPRFRDWGFHPEGKPWVPWREYLGVPA